MFSFGRKKKVISIKSPGNGIIKNIEEVNDPVFAEKMMGDGVAIQIEEGDIYAPASGVLTSVILPSGHAFGIKTKEGLEILVHVGLDTVHLDDGEFTLLKKQDDFIEQGDKIIEINYELIKKKNIDLITPVIVINSNGFDLIKKVGERGLSAKTNIIECIID